MAHSSIRKSGATLPDRVTVRSTDDDDPPYVLIAADVFAAQEPPGYLIEDIVPAGGEIKIVADSNAGKTFIALSMGASVATGLPWLGAYTVKPGLVVYVLAEGARVFPLRLRAWKAFHKITGRIPLYVLAASPQMTGRTSPHVTKLLQTIAALPKPPVLIIFDTQNRCMEGKEENSSRDVGEFLAAVSRIGEETGAAVMVLHHTGWTSGHERGHSSQRGAVDTVILVEKKDDAITVSCEKQKDDEPFKPIPVKLTRVDLGKNTEGKSIDSCVVEYRRALGPSLVDVFSHGGRKRLLRFLVDAGTEGRSHAELATFAAEKGISGSTFERTLKWLVLNGYARKPEDPRRGKYTATEDGQKADKRLRAKAAKAKE